MPIRTIPPPPLAARGIQPRMAFDVLFDPDVALHDLPAIKARDERRAIANVLDKLRQLGPDLAPPHLKRLKGTSGLLELRPRQGNSAARPICFRAGDHYIVLAIAKDHVADLPGAIAVAQERRARRYHRR